MMVVHLGICNYVYYFYHLFVVFCLVLCFECVLCFFFHVPFLFPLVFLESIDDDDAFITVRSSLVPLIEGLCAQIYFRFEISVVCVHIFCFSFSEEKIC